MSFAAWWAQTNQQLVAEAKIEAHIPENIQAVMGLLPEIFADKELPPQLLIELMRNIGYVSMYVEGDRFALLNKANLALDKSPQGRALVLAIRGREMISYAWDGIGRGLAAAPANGPQLFDERIDKARKLLEESWQTWPNCEAATEMIAVLKAQQAPRQEVDQWFARAMSLDSCNHWACLSMIEVLHPKWGGSEEEMLKFARDMAENGNWSGTIPDMVHHVHWQIAFMRPGAKGNYPDRNYFKAADVWKDLQPFYEEQIRRTPTQSWRTYYMLVAAWSEHWDVANEQLRKLRNNPHTRILREATRDMVKEIQAHAKTPTK
jgi:hypothetical protein